MEYKRVTFRNKYNQVDVYNEFHDREPLQRLAELEDKIENGTLIEVLLKTGDKIYQFDNGGKIYENEIKGSYYVNNTLIYDCGYFSFDKRALGERIFLTKAEAEEKIKELGEV